MFQTMTGWWFQTTCFFHFIYRMSSETHWRTHIFKDGYCTTNQLGFFITQDVEFTGKNDDFTSPRMCRKNQNWIYQHQMYSNVWIDNKNGRSQSATYVDLKQLQLVCSPQNMCFYQLQWVSTCSVAPAFAIDHLWRAKIPWFLLGKMRSWGPPPTWMCVIHHFHWDSTNFPKGDPQ